MEKYLYFRTQATSTADTGSDDSICVPLSNVCGMAPTARDTFNIYFKPLKKLNHNRFDHNGDSTSSVNTDYVVVSLSSNDTARTVIAALARLIATSRDPFISIADDQTSEYAVDGISGLSTISVQDAVAVANG